MNTIHTDQQKQLARNLLLLATKLTEGAPTGVDRFDIAASFLSVSASLIIEAVGTEDAIRYMREYVDGVEAIHAAPSAKELN